MANLKSMRSNLSYWNNQINELSARIKKLKRRRTDVESVKSTLRIVANNNAQDINGKMHTVDQKLGTSIEYAGKGNQLASIFVGRNEQGVGIDGNLTSVDHELQQELNEINRQLGNAEASQSQAQGKVRELKSAITAEEQRQIEEERRRREEELRKAEETRKASGGFR